LRRHRRADLADGDGFDPAKIRNGILKINSLKRYLEINVNGSEFSVLNNNNIELRMGDENGYVDVFIRLMSGETATK